MPFLFHVANNKNLIFKKKINLPFLWSQWYVNHIFS